MNKIKFLTAGESHGKALIGIVEGVAAGVSVDEEYMTNQQRAEDKKKKPS